MSSVDGVIGRLQNGNGTVLVSGRGSTWANARELRVGDVEGQGTLMVEGAGTVSNVDSFVGSMSGSGNVIVRGAGSTWNNSGAMTLGFGVGTGAGSLTIAQGGVVNVGASNAGASRWRRIRSCSTGPPARSTLARRWGRRPWARARSTPAISCSAPATPP